MMGTHLLGVVEEICQKISTRQRRGKDTDCLLLPPLLDRLQLLTIKAKDPRGQNIHTREEEGIQRRLLLFLQIIPLMIMEDIKEQDYLHKLQKFWVLCNLLGLWMRHWLYIRIMWCNNQGIQVLNRIRKPGPLTGLLMRWLLPQELCPKLTKENTPRKPLSGIEHLMENRTSTLLMLPQSKLVESTTKFIQSKIDSESLIKDWLCPQHLVASLALTKYY